MIAGRRYLRADELAAYAPAAPSWPVVSIAMLCWLAIVLPAGALTAMNLYLLALVAATLVLRRRPPPKDIASVLAAFGAMLAVGLLGGAGAERYLYLKDAWYVSNPAVLITVGYVFGGLIADASRGLRAFVLGGALVAAGHLLWFLIHPELLRLQATTIRSISGTGYYAAGLAAIILLGHLGRWREELRLGRWAGGICLTLCMASVILSFSRTLYLVMLIGVLSMAGLFAGREWLRVGLLVLCGALAMLALPSVVATGSVEAKQSLSGKLARSLEELRPTERMTIREINENWRGYETARALATWREAGPLRQAFGLGFGAQVDLGIFQNLSRNPRDAVRFIPIFHNGYVYVLVKTGLVGLGLYLAALLLMYRVGRRHAGAGVGDPRRRLGRLLQGCTVAVLVSTWVIAGAFNKLDLFAILLMIGFLIAVLAPHRGDA